MSLIRFAPNEWFDTITDVNVADFRERYVALAEAEYTRVIAGESVDGAISAAFIHAGNEANSLRYERIIAAGRAEIERLRAALSIQTPV